MALIPPFFIDCVAAIGTGDSESERHWVASGFLYGYRLPNGANKAREYQVYLVTNRHVLSKMERAHLRFNPVDNKNAREFSLDLIDDAGKPLWFTHPDDRIDLGVAPINFDLLQERGMQVAYFENDHHGATIEMLRQAGVTEGDFAYVLGFPMGLVGGHRNSVIVRSGTLARIRDVLAGSNTAFLVDAFVFPGNSGGPVVLKPEALAIEGTSAQVMPYLIGVIQAYVPYEDIAVSMQTGRPRIVFEENAGLAAVLPVDFIEETIAARCVPQIQMSVTRRDRRADTADD